MATKYKNTNTALKILIVFVSLVLFTTCIFETVKLINFSNSYSLYEALFRSEYTVDEGTPIASSNYLESYIASDIHSADLELLKKEPELCKKELESQRQKVVNQIINDYKNLDTDYYQKGDGVVGNYTLTLGTTQIELTLETSNPDCRVVYGDSEEAARQKANARFSEYIESGEYITRLEEMISDNFPSHEDFHYYIKNNKTNIYVTNFEKGITPQNVLSKSYAFVVKNGVIQNTDEFRELFVVSSENDVNKVDKEIFPNDEYYVYIDDGYLSTDGIMNVITSVQSARELNVKAVAVKAAVLAFLSVLLALIYFIICGRRKEDGKVKRIFIDLVPSDVHFVLVCAVSAGLLYLAVLAADNSIRNHNISSNYPLFKVAALLCTAVYFLIIEFISSIIRVCKSEKSLFDNILLIKLFSLLVIKPVRFIFRKIKSAFTYKPDNFNKLLVKSLVIYGIINTFFFFVILFSAGDGESGIAGAAGVIVLIYNTVIISYGVWYAVQLDKIITAAHRRTVPNVNYPKLPASLKYLYGAISYSKQELDNAVSKAVRDERMRTELITNVSHDLKTPLTSIITYVDLLKGCDIQDENAREYIEVLDEKGSRLKRLIEDLVEASKITSGVITVQSANLSLNELAAQAVIERQNEFEENGLELVFKGDRHNVNCFADGNKTYRVLDNLLSNAKKYSAKGTRVYCDVYETENFSIFEIKNISEQPLDISPQELKERFVRGDKSRTNEGNGLGLSIADNLCKVQGGHLNLTIDGDLFKAQVMLPKAK